MSSVSARGGERKKLAQALMSHIVALAPTAAIEACKTACQEYSTGDEKGIPAVAIAIGMKEGVLYNKLAGDEDSHHKLTLADALRIFLLTQDLRIPQELVRPMGCVAFQVPDLSKVSDTELIDLLSKAQEEGGEYHGILRHALADGEIDASELLDLSRQLFRWIGAIVEAHARVKGLQRG